MTDGEIIEILKYFFNNQSKFTVWATTMRVVSESKLNNKISGFGVTDAAIRECENLLVKAGYIIAVDENTNITKKYKSLKRIPHYVTHSSLQKKYSHGTENNKI